MDKKISKATMSRFPVYLKALRKMQHEGKETCLSSELFEITGIQDTTIRRDFTYLSKTDNFGRRGRGYDVKHLIDGLSEVLGLGLDESIILIGVGNLGSAILKYNRWQYTVGKIVCGYDMDKNKEGHEDAYLQMEEHFIDLEEIKQAKFSEEEKLEKASGKNYIALIQFSSGSTGVPKGIPIKYESLSTTSVNDLGK